MTTPDMASGTLEQIDQLTDQALECAARNDIAGITVLLTKRRRLLEECDARLVHAGASQAVRSVIDCILEKDQQITDFLCRYRTHLGEALERLHLCAQQKRKYTGGRRNVSTFFDNAV